jgi:hypothetical protein
MRSPKKTAAVALAGAVALSSAAYGIGTQVGDGTAAARDGTAQNGGPPGGWERAPGPGLDDLADELGVDATELRDALRDFHEQEGGERRDAFAAALAEALGKPEDEVEAALDEVRPGDGARRPCGGHVPLRQLATALDVTRPELRKALREVRAGADSAWEDRRADLVAFLAERFGLSEEQVDEALPELAGPGPGPHGPGRPFGRP